MKNKNLISYSWQHFYGQQLTSAMPNDLISNLASLCTWKGDPVAEWPKALLVKKNFDPCLAILQKTVSGPVQTQNIGFTQSGCCRGWAAWGSWGRWTSFRRRRWRCRARSSGRPTPTSRRRFRTAWSWSDSSRWTELWARSAPSGWEEPEWASCCRCRAPRGTARSVRRRSRRWCPDWS